jgi:uncharacterized membrane protein YphA (DoxX/SURF4 family)
MSKLPLVARILLGLVFFVFGLNGFFHFIPQPPPSGPAGEFGTALAATGYMFPLLKATETVVGALLLSGRFVPLALTVLAPVMVNILAFHLALEHSGMGMVAVLLLLHVYLAYAYRAAFAPLLRAGAAPAAPSASAAKAPAAAGA